MRPAVVSGGVLVAAVVAVWVPTHLLTGGDRPVRLPPVPGAYNPRVTERTVNRTVCVHGWSSIVRPDERVTERLKHELLDREGLPGRVSDYQLDHLVSLSLGGSPASRRNLWMQPVAQARKDDRLEFGWYRQLCDEHRGLRSVQREELEWKRRHG